jgi:anhydro-N-acetylmuramic acid kinase
MLVIGLISGTSIDAIDAALVEIARQDDELQVAVRAFTMQPFAEPLRERVRALLPPNSGSTAEVCEVNVLLGEAFAEAALAVAQDAGVPLSSVDLIASHGQTVYHQVAPGTVRSTLQLGTPAVIAEQTGCTVVADLRPRDMVVGGEGAPLVPFLDQLLFTDNQKYRAIQNIGGIGNVTLLSPHGAELAFDTGPGNVLIDEAVRLLTGGPAHFDHDGRLAAAGQIDQDLLAEWLRHPFFDQPPPKSTGREQWGPAEARGYVEQARQRGLRSEDTIATLTALTAQSIALAYARFLPQVDEALIGGGGARNPTLMRLLRQALAPLPVRPVDDLALSADAKEAVAFALMGYATLHGWPGNVPAATGAAQPVVLGSITPGLRYRSLMQRALSAPVAPPTRARLIDPRDLR